MIRRSTWILLGVFLAVLAVALYVQGANDDDITEDVFPTSEVTQLEEQPSLFDLLDGGVLVGLRVESAEGEVVNLGRADENNDWALLQPTSPETDVDAVMSVVEQLNGILVEADMEPGIELEALGLDAPAYQIALTFADGRTQVAKIGDVTITESSYYVQVDEQLPQVASRYKLDRLIDWLTYPPVPPMSSPELDLEATPQP